jgi:hypothetical protein
LAEKLQKDRLKGHYLIPAIREDATDPKSLTAGSCAQPIITGDKCPMYYAANVFVAAVDPADICTVI